MILHVFCECRSKSFVLREAKNLRVFQNKVLRRIFGSKWQKDLEARRKLKIFTVSAADVITVIKRDEMGRFCKIHRMEVK
jgi:hypothetical protein